MEKQAKIEKPIIIVLNETEAKVVKALNESSLPAFILKPMLERILNQTQEIEKKEIEEATRIYNEQLMKAGEK